MEKIVLLLILCPAEIVAGEHAGGGPGAHQPGLPTLELAAATDGVFGNGAAVVPVYKGLLAEGVWYHSQGRNMGFAGLGYQFVPRPYLILVPSLYAVRSNNGEHDTAALGLRLLLETRRTLIDFSLIRAMGGGKSEDHDIFMDPSHLSFRAKKLQIGYAGEFFRHIGSHDSGHGRADTDEILHGPRLGWEISPRMHAFGAVLKKPHGWEIKFGASLFLADWLRERTR